MIQKGVIKLVFGTLGLNVGTTNGKFTPIKGSLLLNMFMGILPLAISTKVEWLEFYCILLNTHVLKLLVKSTELQDKSSAKGLCMDKPCSYL